MAISVTVTPGTVVQENDKITSTILNQIATPTVDIDGAISSLAISDNSITTAKIAAGSVTGVKLASSVADGSTIELTSNTLSLKDLGVTNAKLADSEVSVTAGAALTGGGSVSLGNSISLDVAVDDSTIEVSGDALRLKAGGVTASHIATDAVGSSEIAADAVTATEIAADAVTATEIAADAVGSSEIAADAVGSSEIAANAVGSSEIAAGAVGSSELATDAVTATEIAAGAVGSSEIAAGAVDSSELATDAVTAAKIAAGAVGSSEIAAGAVGSSELATDAVTATEIAAGAVGSSEIAAGAVGSSELSSTSVSSGSYTAADITVDAEGRVTAASDGTGGTVLQVVTAVVTANTFVSTSTSMVDVTGLSASITPASASNKILVQVMASVGGNGNGGVIAGLKRGTTQIGSSTNATGVQQNGIASTMFGGDDRLDNLTMIYEDSPATTSSTTYQVTAASGSTSYNVRLNRPDTLTDSAHVYHGISTITLTEIAG